MGSDRYALGVAPLGAFEHAEDPQTCAGEHFRLRCYADRRVVETESGFQIVGVSPIVQAGRTIPPEIAEYAARAERVLRELAEVLNEGAELQRKQRAPDWAGVHIDYANG